MRSNFRERVTKNFHFEVISQRKWPSSYELVWMKGWAAFRIVMASVEARAVFMIVATRIEAQS